MQYFLKIIVAISYQSVSTTGMLHVWKRSIPVCLSGTAHSSFHTFSQCSNGMCGLSLSCLCMCGVDEVTVWWGGGGRGPCQQSRWKLDDHWSDSHHGQIQLSTMTVTWAAVTTGTWSHLPGWRGEAVADFAARPWPFVRQMSSWHWRVTGPLNSHCLRECLSLFCHCTGRWKSRPRWTVRPLPPRSPPGCHHSRHGAPSH